APPHLRPTAAPSRSPATASSVRTASSTSTSRQMSWLDASTDGIRKSYNWTSNHLCHTPKISPDGKLVPFGVVDGAGKVCKAPRRHRVRRVAVRRVAAGQGARHLPAWRRELAGREAARVLSLRAAALALTHTANVHTRRLLHLRPSGSTTIGGVR